MKIEPRPDVSYAHTWRPETPESRLELKSSIQPPMMNDGGNVELAAGMSTITRAPARADVTLARTRARTAVARRTVRYTLSPAGAGFRRHTRHHPEWSSIRNAERGFLGVAATRAIHL